MSEKRDKVIRGLECCARENCEECPYTTETYGEIICDDDNHELLLCASVLLKTLYAFKLYFDDLYGKGLGVIGFHLNGATESFDNFYDSALQEMRTCVNGKKLLKVWNVAEI